MSGNSSIMTRSRTRLALSRHHPYQPPATLPRCEETESRASLVEDHPVLPDCDTLSMHNITVIPITEDSPQLLNCEVQMQECPEGFISLTDPRLSRSETVWNVEIKTMSITNSIQMFKAVRGERIVYSMRWEGGGKITTRIL
ncbi:control protein E4orf6/7 [Human adenovirus 4]|uniref:Control protein E4orf6/7 n=4 Tax=Human mastadenovirus E TaxID=130308 RepID=A0A1U9ALE9_ADE04|nr:E4 ORF6/7 [Human mastadenovirus E]ANQ44095.1 control protein E4orf6/7 [Human adenovirus E4]WMP40375.1 E4 ORF6/7 [Expression vector Ad4-GFPdeltaE1]WMP40390.1 E4 ORF6/7 [Expression vector Ad4-GFPdeltaE1deltaE3]AAS66941.1 E4 ORF6/7 [Human mastadenovirus E]ANQ44133.1 control protein E4orf6/7 [Human adenovirus E4]